MIWKETTRKKNFFFHSFIQSILLFLSPSDFIETNEEEGRENIQQKYKS